jgi:hypothetical protein
MPVETPLTWILDSLATSDLGALEGLGWPGGGADPELVSIEVVRAAGAEHPSERVRFRCAGRTLEAELDLRDREPHQVASIRLQCAIGMSPPGQAGLLVHSAGLALPGCGAVVALAPSGGGKSTLSNLCSGFVGLSDETVLLCPGPPPRIFATPLRSSSTQVPQPRTEPLKALLFLEKNVQPSFARILPPEALKLLLAQAYKLPQEIASTALLFKRATELVQKVPAYRFAFPKSPAAQELLLRLFDEALGG